MLALYDIVETLCFQHHVTDGSAIWMRIRIRIQQLKLMRIHADPDLDTDPKPWSNLPQLRVGGNDVPLKMLLPLMEYMGLGPLTRKMYFCNTEKNVLNLGNDVLFCFYIVFYYTEDQANI